MEANAPEPPRPPRRVRYRGRHPRHFAEKYKELDPQRDPATVAKVLAAGKTPAGGHVPVMLEESILALRLMAGMRGIDATLGYGGHAAGILEKIGETGSLLGLDQDPLELPKTIARFAERGIRAPRLIGVRSNYAGIQAAIAAQGWTAAEFIFADLGCSSMQLDDPARGFSYKADGPLDMRMNPNRSVSARGWLRAVAAADLARSLAEDADEPAAEALAEALAGKDLATTGELRGLIEQVLANADDSTRTLAVKRVFQALRIAVNDEFGSLKVFLRALPDCLAAGAAVAILTFHSGEDRRVKRAFKEGLATGRYSEISREIIRASPAEQSANPRSRPAKLRYAVKISE